MTERRNPSNIDYGLTSIRSRPAEIPMRSDPRWAHLSTYAVERMAVARMYLMSSERPSCTRRRLCKFWSDLSHRTMVERLDDLVLGVLGDLADYEYVAAGFWFDGIWHNNGVVMARLLWHVQMPDHLVTAALDLHRRVSQRSTVDEDASRGGSFIRAITMV
jgi:hypothetical protein